MNKDAKSEAPITGERFEVRKGGKVYQSGPVKLIPDAEARKQMRSGGYGVFIDGKAFRR